MSEYSDIIVIERANGRVRRVGGRELSDLVGLATRRLTEITCLSTEQPHLSNVFRYKTAPVPASF